MKIKKGDKVKVIKGKDSGKESTVIKSFPRESKVLVENVNLYKKNQKPRGEKNPGGIITLTRPLRVENVRLLCPKCNKATRVGYRLEKDNKKYRYCKKCHEIIK